MYWPTFSEIMAVSRSRGANSDAPNLWDGLVGAWPLQEGAGDTAFDVSGYGNHGTLTDMDPATDWVVSDKGKCLDFDGSNDYVDCGDIEVVDGATQMSCGLWGRFHSISDDDSFMRKWASGSWAFAITFHENAGRFRMLIGDNTDILSVVSDGSVLATGVWCRIDAVWHGGKNIALYFDGQQISSSINDNNFISALTDVGEHLSLMARYNGGNPDSFVNGEAYGFTLHNRALTPSEIQQLYVDPWAMYRQRRTVVLKSAAAPTGKTYWPEYYYRHLMAGNQV